MTNTVKCKSVFDKKGHRNVVFVSQKSGRLIPRDEVPLNLLKFTRKKTTDGRTFWYLCGKSIHKSHVPTHLKTNEKNKKNEQKLVFDRERIIDAEGYWAESKDPHEDEYRGKYPWPISHKQPWKGESEFLNRLIQIQNDNKHVKTLGFRGLAPSRLEHRLLGAKEFRHIPSGIRWTDVFGDYYVKKFHVIPSRQFYEFVMNYRF